MPALFALDENFPEPIVEALSEWIEEATLVPLRRIDSRLSSREDWEILLALYLSDQPWDGLVTTDSGMLAQPREIATLIQTKLTLVVAEEAGHDAIKATGIILAHLPSIAKQTRATESQVWRLRITQKQPDDPWEILRSVAEHQARVVAELYEQAKLTAEELTTDPLARGM